MNKWLQLAEKHDLPRMASIQNEYSLLCRNFEPDLSEIALSEDCGLLAWSPLTRGILSGKYLNGAKPEGARLTIETRVEHRGGTETDAATVEYMALAQRYDLDPCQMAIAFVNQQKFVSSTLIGATTMEQLRSNIDAINMKLSDEILNEIKLIRRKYPMLF
jgi:aryl-alcohol dehydrogenase-like predicted oxidoreductase